MNLSGSPVDYITAFFAGVLFSFTPCVYPLIPVSIGYIGIEASGSKARAFKLSLLYVTGVAIAYSLLGLLASLTASIFGEFSFNPWLHMAIGAGISLLGFLMLGVFHLPSLILVKAPSIKAKNGFFAFLLGMVSAFVIGPCTTPVLGSILLFIAGRRNILYGMTLMLCFAYGMGLILIAAGTYGALLARLPKSGIWTLWIKRLYAIILVAVGVYIFVGGFRRL